jgi:DNA-binding ferritin-like protein (Dps family)
MELRVFKNERIKGAKMIDLIYKLMGDKREWRAMEARAKALPNDYQIVYKEMQGYMWKFSSGDGMDIVKILKDVLELFETGVAEKKHVLEVTGEDVAGFCDELLRSANTYTEDWHDSLNFNVKKKLKKETL